MAVMTERSCTTCISRPSKPDGELCLSCGRGLSRWSPRTAALPPPAPPVEPYILMTPPDLIRLAECLGLTAVREGDSVLILNRQADAAVLVTPMGRVLAGSLTFERP